MVSDPRCETDGTIQHRNTRPPTNSHNQYNQLTGSPPQSLSSALTQAEGPVAPNMLQTIPHAAPPQTDRKTVTIREETVGHPQHSLNLTRQFSHISRTCLSLPKTRFDTTDPILTKIQSSAATDLTRRTAKKTNQARQRKHNLQPIDK